MSTDILYEKKTRKGIDYFVNMIKNHYLKSITKIYLMVKPRDTVRIPITIIIFYYYLGISD